MHFISVAELARVPAYRSELWRVPLRKTRSDRAISGSWRLVVFHGDEMSLYEKSDIQKMSSNVGKWCNMKTLKNTGKQGKNDGRDKRVKSRMGENVPNVIRMG